MQIATILFTYNRSLHTKKVLDALKENTIRPAKLYIFQDGLKKQEDYEEWLCVNEQIKNIDWCESHFVVAKKNKGLAASIVDGINQVFKSSDAVIVLEDDCVAHPQFMEYMNQALEKYAGDSRVYAINGYGWPADAEKNGTDAYFAGRAGSWGWGTWKERWAEYEQDYKLLGRIKKDPVLAEQLRIWGEDLESYVLGNVEGSHDSWTVFWALKVIEQNGCCLTPYESFIENIGFDGTGVHCASENVTQNLRAHSLNKKVLLPSAVEFPGNYAQAFEGIFSWISKEKRLACSNNKLSCYNKLLLKWVGFLKKNGSLSDTLKKQGINKVALWGKGKICDLLLDELENSIDVSAIIESSPQKDFYGTIPLVRCEDIPEGTQLVIVIPVYDWEKIKEKLEKIDTVRAVGLDQLLEV